MQFFTTPQNQLLPECSKNIPSLPFQLISSHLQTVEQYIAKQAQAFDPAVSSYIAYACHSHGKRLRPALALLTGGATGGITPAHVDLAVVLELVHLATLVHDDIIDEAELRRDKPTANAKWGSTTSVLLGDCLFAHALSLSTRFEERDICRSIATAASDVCTGEIIQTQRRYDWALTLEEYLQIIEKKTAAFFVMAAELAAKLNGSPAETVAACSFYGRQLGVAYQVYDDCLDIVGSEETAGKTLGTDLLKGKLTLPVLKLLKASSDIRHSEICELLTQANQDGMAKIRKAVIEGGHIRESALFAKGLVDEAQVHMAALEDSEYRQTLQGVGEFFHDLLNRFLEFR